MRDRPVKTMIMVKTSPSMFATIQGSGGGGHGFGTGQLEAQSTHEQTPLVFCSNKKTFSPIRSTNQIGNEPFVPLTEAWLHETLSSLNGSRPSKSSPSSLNLK